MWLNMLAVLSILIISRKHMHTSNVRLRMLIDVGTLDAYRDGRLWFAEVLPMESIE